MKLYVIRDVYTDGRQQETDCLTWEEAHALLIQAAAFIDSGTLRESFIFDREGNEIART
jgi:hypothetical protein